MKDQLEHRFSRILLILAALLIGACAHFVVNSSITYSTYLSGSFRMMVASINSSLTGQDDFNVLARDQDHLASVATSGSNIGQVIHEETTPIAHMAIAAGADNELYVLSSNRLDVYKYTFSSYIPSSPIFISAAYGAYDIAASPDGVYHYLVNDLKVRRFQGPNIVSERDLPRDSMVQVDTPRVAVDRYTGVVYTGESLAGTQTEIRITVWSSDLSSHTSYDYPSAYLLRDLDAFNDHVAIDRGIDIQLRAERQAMALDSSYSGLAWVSNTGGAISASGRLLTGGDCPSGKHGAYLWRAVNTFFGEQVQTDSPFARTSLVTIGRRLLLAPITLC